MNKKRLRDRFRRITTGLLCIAFLQTTLFPFMAMAQIVPATTSVAMATIIPQPALRPAIEAAAEGLRAGGTPSRFSVMDIKEAGLRDALERQTGVTDPRTGTSITHYNAATGQVDYVEDAATNRTSFTYDATSGRKLTETNALNQVTRFGYDTQGRVTQVWGDVPYPVRYTFDTYGRLHLMDTWRQGTAWNATTFPTNMEASKDTTTWNYQESTGLLIAKLDVAGRGPTYTYTTGGKLATRTWARGGSTGTTYSYDPATGELLNINYADTTPDVTFTYDRLGRQLTITDGVGSRTFAYNATLQPDTETITGLYNRTLTRAYATSGVVGRSTGFDTGANYSITYGYDNTTGRLNNVGWNVGGAGNRSASYTYEPGSDLPATRTMGSQVTTYSYETNRDLKTQVRNQYNGATVSQYDYVSDAIGRRTSVANTGSAFSAAAFNRFDYNDRSELAESARYLGTDVDILTNPVQSEYRHFNYDPIGNRTALTVASNSGTYATSNLNQYTSSTLPAKMFFYDVDGNLGMMTGTKPVTYMYDLENRMVSAAPTSPAVNDKKIEFTYDYQGRRVQKVISSWTGSAWAVENTKVFVYDGWNLIEEVTTGTNAGTRYYVWGLDLSQTMQGAGGIGGLLAKVESGATHLYQYDGNGNVGQLVNASTGSVDAQYEYDAYGNSIVTSGTQAAGNPFRFSTKYLDTESGLYYYGYRFYDPETGRWLSRDPIEEAGGFNLYLFSVNNPANYFDALGHSPFNWFCVQADFILLGIDMASGNRIGVGVGSVTLVYDILAGAVPVPLPPGSIIAKIILRATSSPLAKSMRVALLAGKDKVDKVIRYAVTKLDEAHHMIPPGALPKWLGQTKTGQIKCIQEAAERAGIILEEDAINGVSLTTSYHRLKGGVGDDVNTLQEWYFDEVIRRFEGIEGNELFTKELDNFAEWLLKESKKKEKRVGMIMNFFKIYVAENDSAEIDAKFREGEESPIMPAWKGQKVTCDRIILKNYKKKGIFYDWMPGISWAPYVKTYIKDRLEDKLGEWVQWVGPFQVEGHELYLLNCINVIDCAFPKSNHNNLLLNMDELKDQVIFRPKRFEKDLIITEWLKEEIETARDTGIRFGKIREDGWMEHPYASLDAPPPVWKLEK